MSIVSHGTTTKMMDDTLIKTIFLKNIIYDLPIYLDIILRKLQGSSKPLVRMRTSFVIISELL